MKFAKILLMLSTLASFAFAGPGPQYWQNQTNAAAAREATKSDKVAPSEKAAGTMKDGVCAKCASSSKCACSSDTKSKG